MAYRNLTQDHVTIINALWKLSKEGKEWTAPALLTAPTKLSLPVIKEALQYTCGRWITKMSKKGEYRFSNKGQKEFPKGVYKLAEPKTAKAPTAPKKAAPKPVKQAKPAPKAPAKAIQPARTATVKKFIVKKPVVSAPVAPATEAAA